MISATFGQVLRSGRDHFNAQFASARHANPKLDGDSFARFLTDVIDPIVQAIDASRPERTADFAKHAYAVALELSTLRLIGPDARHTAVETAWRRLLIPAAPLIALEPRRALASVSNAAHQLAATKGTRSAVWLETMESAARNVTDLETWLTIGLIAAWRAGLAQYRTSALSLCDRVPPALALAAICASGDATWKDVRAGLAKSPWYDATAQRPTPSLRIAARAGEFRGFGGSFAELPRVRAFHDHFLVSSGNECWILTADAFGATFHRATAEETAGMRPPTNEATDVQVEGTQLVVGHRKLDLSDLGRITSIATSATTIAVTGHLTYAIVLIERPLS